jgi:hypothetical protein
MQHPATLPPASRAPLVNGRRGRSTGGNSTIRLPSISKHIQTVSEPVGGTGNKPHYTDPVDAPFVAHRAQNVQVGTGTTNWPPVPPVGPSRLAETALDTLARSSIYLPCPSEIIERSMIMATAPRSKIRTESIIYFGGRASTLTATIFANGGTAQHSSIGRRP